MKNNNEILNELFFKKKNKSYKEQFDDKLGQYKPVSNVKDTKNLFASSIDGNIQISDMDEVKKRLVGALGMAMGSNTIKSMASKAIKSFPIIISDDISSETLVMVKNMMEEQYASYIDLLVSNQIINITDYKPGSSDGNIAIQALNKLDGTEFGTGRIARQAQTGSLTIDDIMKNQPWWQLIRTNEKFESGNPLLDLFLEDAIVIPSKYEKPLLESLLSQTSSTFLNEASIVFNTMDNDPKVIEQAIKRGFLTQFPEREIQNGDTAVNSFNNHVYRYVNNSWIDESEKVLSTDNLHEDVDVNEEDIQKLRTELAKDRYNKYKMYYDKADKRMHYDALITPSIFDNANHAEIESALNTSLAELMTEAPTDTPQQREMKNSLRDRFTKATFLLTSQRIAGKEYISYLVDRLGIPVSQKTKQEILLKFKVADTQFRGIQIGNNNGIQNSYKKEVKRLQQNINNNQSYVFHKLTPNIVSLSAKDVAQIAGLSLGAGAVTGGAATGIAAATVGLVSSAALPIILVPALAGALGAGIFAWLRKRKIKKINTQRIEGWERVEALINQMEQNKLESTKNLADISYTNDDFNKENQRLYDDFYKKMDTAINTSVKEFNKKKDRETNENFDISGYVSLCSENHLLNCLDDLQDLEESLQNNKDVLNEQLKLNEAKRFTISTTNPSSITIKNILTGKKSKINPDKYSSVVPEFGTKDIQAYGTVEYDKRDIKDRKFNDPLILTIKFRERYSDGKYDDNELTAVIGIKGVITRVPSNEMEYVLKSNVEGKTLSDFFKGDEKNTAKNLIGNVISSFMGTKYADNLPTSGKVWSNLEKVGQLAIANKLSGNNNGNIANAHLVFSQKEIDRVKNETGVDYLKNTKISAQLMKKYSAFMLMVCDDALQKVYSFSDPDSISWDDAPYSAYIGKSNSDQLISAFTQAQRMRL